MKNLAISFLVMLAAAAGRTTAQTPTLRVAGTAVRIQQMQAQPMAAATALLPFAVRIRLNGWQAHAVLFEDTLAFQSGSPFFRHRGRVQQLAAPVVFRDSTIWLPLQFFTEWLPRAYPTRLAYQAGALNRVGSGVAVRDSAQRAQPDSVLPSRPAESAAAKRATRVVVLDAGHGGVDPGKPGPNRLLEKTVALAVANKLAGFLRERGYEVHLTRKSDTLIALADRPHLANVWKASRPAAVFVSLHANSGVRAARGFETYFLSAARTEDERRVAEMENAAVEYENGPGNASAPELDQILSGLKNDFYLRASNSLAELIQGSLATVHPGPNRGVKQAAFRVLVGAVMPAVLVEMAFISNVAEARLLGTSAFQQKIAYSLAQAIDRFFETHQHLLVTGPGQ